MANKMCDFIMVPRSIFRDESLDDGKYSRREAFLYLVQRACHQQQTVPVKGGVIELKRGQLCDSVRRLANTWGWSKDKVSRTLAAFQSEQRIDICTDGLTSVISILNYDTYQPLSDGNKDGNKDADKDTNKDANKDKYNKDNKGNKDNKQKKTSNDVKESRKRFVPPTADEVRAYCQENGYIVDAEYFVDYYEQGGWVYGKARTPMKDWKAAVRQWASRDKKRQEVNPAPAYTPPAQPKKEYEYQRKFEIVSGGFDF